MRTGQIDNTRASLIARTTQGIRSMTNNSALAAAVRRQQAAGSHLACVKLVRRQIDSFDGHQTRPFLQIPVRPYLAAVWGILSPVVELRPNPTLDCGQEIIIRCKTSGSFATVDDLVRRSGSIFQPPGWLVGDSRYRRLNIDRRHATLVKNTYTAEGFHVLEGQWFQALDLPTTNRLLDGSIEMDISSHSPSSPNRQQHRGASLFEQSSSAGRSIA